tara:strand:- start:384 stop:1070 length:687 start_codon:yes stop_codon:yes gene_type:complete
MDKILSISEKYKLFIVEDSAQALGSKFNNKYAGTFGKASAISFYPAKTLGCFGDGGALITNDEFIYDKAYQLHDHGRNKDGEFKSWGRNSRLDNLQAAFLSYNLKNYDSIIARRREIAKMYNDALKDIEELKLPPKPEKDSLHFDVYQNYEMVAERRDEFKKYLENQGISTLIQWGGKALHQYENLDIREHLPAAEEFFRKCIMIPIHPYLTNSEVSYIIEKIKDFYK